MESSNTDHDTLAERLGTVERKIRLHHHPRQVEARRSDVREPDETVTCTCSPAQFVDAGQLRAHGDFGVSSGASPSGMFRNEDHELVAALARDHDVARAEILQPVCHRAQQGIALRMAERVVDMLEVVDVEHDEHAIPSLFICFSRSLISVAK
jgi:hypothetical protein